MLRIRLRRVGRKNDPHFQIVVTPKTNATKGNYLEKLGWFDPVSKQIQIDETGLKKWLDNGAKPTNTVARLLVGKKIKHKLLTYTPAKPKAPKKKDKDEKEKSPKPEEKVEAPAEPSSEEVKPDEKMKKEETSEQLEKKEASKPADNKEPIESVSS